MSLLGIACADGGSPYDAMRRDLEALRELQEIHKTRHWTYTYLPEDLGFAPSMGVTISLSASRDGWTATAAHAALGRGPHCAVYWGDGSQYLPTIMEGQGIDPGDVYCTG